INAGDQMQYRVVPIVAAGGNFQPVDAEASDRSDPNEASAESGAGLAGIFNRGIIMSQAVVTVARLKTSNRSLPLPASQCGAISPVSYGMRCSIFSPKL